MWLVLFNVSLVWGVMLPWASLLPIILRPLGVSQSTTGLIGTYALLICATGSFIFDLYVLYSIKWSELWDHFKRNNFWELPRFAINLLLLRSRQIKWKFHDLLLQYINMLYCSLQDILKGRMKSSMILLNAEGAAGFSIFCLMAIGFIPFHTVRANTNFIALIFIRILHLN